MSNLKTKIDGYNKKLLEKTPPPKAKPCNYLKKKLPNEKNPLTKNVLYYAIISCDDEKYKSKLYKGIIETTFKKRYANHTNSLSVEKTRTTQSYVQNAGS